MEDGFTIKTKDHKNRSINYEFWFHDDFIACHVHGFTDSINIAKCSTRNREIFGCWYFCQESFIPKFVFEKIFNSQKIMHKFKKWYLCNK